MYLLLVVEFCKYGLMKEKTNSILYQRRQNNWSEKSYQNIRYDTANEMLRISGIRGCQTRRKLRSWVVCVCVCGVCVCGVCVCGVSVWCVCGVWCMWCGVSVWCGVLCVWCGMWCVLCGVCVVCVWCVCVVGVWCGVVCGVCVCGVCRVWCVCVMCVYVCGVPRRPAGSLPGLFVTFGCVCLMVQLKKSPRDGTDTFS